MWQKNATLSPDIHFVLLRRVTRSASLVNMGSPSHPESMLPSYSEVANLLDAPNPSLRSPQEQVAPEDRRVSILHHSDLPLYNPNGDSSTTHFKADSKQTSTSAEIRPVSSSLSATHWGPDAVASKHREHLGKKLKQKFRGHTEHDTGAHGKPRWQGNRSQHLVSASGSTETQPTQKDPERWQRRRHQAAKVAGGVAGVALVAFLIIL